MNNSSKILDIEKLVEEVKRIKQGNKKIVLCHGCFDLLHIGHIRHFRQAKQSGDILVVTITPDFYVDKGPGRPAFSEELRLEAIASLDIVDYVSINKWPTAEKTIRLIEPDFYAKGSEFGGGKSDYTGKIAEEINAIQDVGGQMVFTEDIVFSSTNLINRFLKNSSEEMREYFTLFSQRYSIEDIHNVIDKMADLKVLVIGDAIIDDYHYCEAIGKSSKDPVMALKYKSNDLFAGGVLAVANHLSSFVKQIELYTVLGGVDSQEAFIRKKLSPNVEPHFVFHPDAPTIVKRRFIDSCSFNKLLEIYIMNGNDLPDELDSKLCEFVGKDLEKYDLVVAADFGHGAISKNMIEILCNQSPYLAVNTQANAGNRGFHTITSYKKADFVSLAEHEIRLETRDLIGPLRGQIDKVANQMDCQTFIVTRARRGCLIRGKNGTFVSVPSLSSKVVDKVGAGDAFFSLTALASVLGVAEELIGFLGNVAGSLAVESIGNQTPTDKMSIKKYITTLLK